jgi:NADPH-dependent curcumin reductase
MPQTTNRRVLLKDRPMGPVGEHHFKLDAQPLPPVEDGQVLRRTLWLSLDPYMRARMIAATSYAKSVEIGEVMVGGTVSEVVQSRNVAFTEGDLVLGADGWQEFGVSDGGDLQKLSPSPWPWPLPYALGVLGMPGMTAYVGMLDIAQPKANETVVVSSAAGAVGSVACQIAKIAGCRVIGIAGHDEKCKYVVEELGCDGCVNYRTQNVYRALRKLCGDGVDVYFDNTGGPATEAILRLINPHARIALIGMISQYDATELPPGPNLVPLLVNRAMIKGVLVSDHPDRREAFLRDVSAWLGEGRIKCRQHVVDGLENAPRAFLGLFSGENFGKLLIHVAGP